MTRSGTEHSRAYRASAWAVGLLAALSATAAAPALTQAPPAPSAPPPATASVQLQSFERVWAIIHQRHFDETFNGVDWEAVREEFRPEAEAAESREAIRGVIRRMIARLGQSHFALIPAEASAIVDPAEWEAEDEPDQPANATDDDATDTSDNSGEKPKQADAPEDDEADPADDAEEDADFAGQASPGIDVRLVGDRAVVTSVRPGSPADEAGVKTGWIVTRAGGRNVDELIEQIHAELDEGLDERRAAFAVSQLTVGAMRGQAGETVRVHFIDGDDQPHETDLPREPDPGELVKLGNLPPFRSEFQHGTHEHNGHAIGVIRFSIWMLPAALEFRKAMDALRSSDGIVLDLRGNPGGVAGMSMSIAGHFVNEKQTFGVMTTRRSSLNFIAFPQRVSVDDELVDPFSGPLAILTDEGTGSTSEVFAGGLQSIGRARVFGSTSMGAALPASTERLPNGDVLLFAFANYVDANGVQLEGRGVVPDEPVALTREALLEGRDPVLEAALDWIAAQNAPTD